MEWARSNEFICLRELVLLLSKVVRKNQRTAGKFYFFFLTNRFNLYPNRFAYVDFSTEEEKRAAITRSEQPLIGRRLLIKDGEFPKKKISRQLLEVEQNDI